MITANLNEGISDPVLCLRKKPNKIMSEEWEVQLFIQRHGIYDFSKKIVQSPLFAQAFFKERQLKSGNIPFVTTSSDDVVAFGRVCDWPSGVASKVMNGDLVVRTISVIWRHTNYSSSATDAPSEATVVVTTTPESSLLREQTPENGNSSRSSSSQKQTARRARSPSFRLDTPIMASLNDAIFDYHHGKQKVYKVGFIKLDTGAISCGYCTDQGHRPHMEDEVLIELDLERFDYQTKLSLLSENERLQFERKYPKHSYFAVFDGHNGSEAVNFVMQRLPAYLVQSADFPTNVPRAIRTAFQSVDNEFVNMSVSNNWESGTTAVSLVVSQNKVIVSHAGDSRAVLCRAGKAVQLTRDHSPDSPSEMRRIEKVGGFVLDGRLANLLGVSRSFGDVDLETGAKITGLSIDPEISEVILDEKADEFIILASDGLWEVFSLQTAVTKVRKSIQRNGDVEKASAEIVQAALDRGSTDNLSVIILSFHERKGFLWQGSDSRKKESMAVETNSKRPRFNLSKLQQALSEVTT